MWNRLIFFRFRFRVFDPIPIPIPSDSDSGPSQGVDDGPLNLSWSFREERGSPKWVKVITFDHNRGGDLKLPTFDHEIFEGPLSFFLKLVEFFLNLMERHIQLLMITWQFCLNNIISAAWGLIWPESESAKFFPIPIPIPIPAKLPIPTDSDSDSNSALLDERKVSSCYKNVKLEASGTVVNWSLCT